MPDRTRRCGADNPKSRKSSPQIWTTLPDVDELADAVQLSSAVWVKSSTLAITRSIRVFAPFLADVPDPTIWHLDGSGMDWGEFAFDIYRRTREEWEAEQRDYEEFSRRCDARDAERRRLGVDYPADGQHPAGSVWSSSFFIADSPDVPLGIRLFGIGGHLAELITDLREPPRVSAGRGSPGKAGRGSPDPPLARPQVSSTNSTATSATSAKT